MHVRNISEDARGHWATYVRAVRESLGLNKSAFAAKVGKDRGTIHRWEIGRNSPEDPDVVAQVAAVGGRPVDEALAAAGLRPGTPPPPPPTPPPDPELDLIRAHPRLSAARKKELIRWVLIRRARDEQARLEDLRHLTGDADVG